MFAVHLCFALFESSHLYLASSVWLIVRSRRGLSRDHRWTVEVQNWSPCCFTALLKHKLIKGPFFIRWSDQFDWLVYWMIDDKMSICSSWGCFAKEEVIVFFLIWWLENRNRKITNTLKSKFWNSIVVLMLWKY